MEARSAFSASDAHTAATRMPTRTSSFGVSSSGWYPRITSVSSSQTCTRANGSVSVWPGYCTGVMIV